MSISCVNMAKRPCDELDVGPRVLAKLAKIGLVNYCDNFMRGVLFGEFESGDKVSIERTIQETFDWADNNEPRSYEEIEAKLMEVKAKFKDFVDKAFIVDKGGMPSGAVAPSGEGSGDMHGGMSSGAGAPSGEGTGVIRVVMPSGAGVPSCDWTGSVYGFVPSGAVVPSGEAPGGGHSPIIKKVE